MYVSLELTRCMVDWATMVLGRRRPGDRGRATPPRRVSLQVSRAGRHIGQEAIQLHGGIGDDRGVLRRHATPRHLTALDHLLGDGGHHLRELAGAVTTYEALDPLD